jgi:enhancer of mRNA-decapping protein 3
MKGGERWEVGLADVGLNITLRSDEAVAFGAQWVVDLRFIEGDPQGVEQ